MAMNYNGVDLTIDQELYIRAKEYIRRTKPENRGELYYTLLDWCDKHQDVRESVARVMDTYDVYYIDKNGVSHLESFTIGCGYNPYSFARKRYGELLSEQIQAVELRHRPNPYIAGPERMGRLIFSYDMDDN